MNGLVILRLFLICLVPAGASIGMYFIQKKTKFNKLSYIWQQIIIGVIFGGIAIFGTEVGVDLGGSIANVRDAGPLCAGLIFGGPSGMIAGVIGGVHRALQPIVEGKGAYSQIACSLSTVIAGAYAWLLRRFMFDNKRPNWGFGLAIGMVMEVVHMTILFLTKMDNLTQVYEIIKILALPMILTNGIAVMIPCLVLEIVNRKEYPIKGRYKKLTNQIQLWMLGAVVTAFVLTTFFSYFAETSNAINDADIKLETNITDVSNDVGNSLYNDILKIADAAGNLYKNDHHKEEINGYKLQEWCNDPTVKIDEISIIKRDNEHTKEGIPVPYIAASSYEPFDPTRGAEIFYMDGEQASPFNCLLGKKTDKGHRDLYVQEAAYRDFDHVYFKYAGISLLDYGNPTGNVYLQIGYKFYSYLDNVQSKVQDLSEYRHIGNTGKIIVAYDDIVGGETYYYSISEGPEKRDLTNAGFGTNILPNIRYQGYIEINKGKPKLDCYYKYDVKDGFIIMGLIGVNEVNTNRDNNLILTSFNEVIIFAILFAIIYILIKKLVVNNISEVNTNLGKIIDGNLDVTLNIKGSDEFESLSDDINTTVSTLKRYIDEAAHRIDEELKFAKAIQMSALPNTYPAFPNVKNIDILAKMFTAKEVGGDFYDYYLLDSKRIGFLIADVSGKGIPAAMFMMQSKALIKNFAAQYENTNDIITHANDEICKENEAGMFVTCWFGIINLETGVVQFTNAGHNPPIIYRAKENKWEYLKTKAGFVLAGFDGYKYSEEKIKLEPGDKIFLYTDGVTEATREDKVLYGEDRLINYLSKHNNNIQKTLSGIKTDIDNFIDGAPQFDDITMLMLEYKEKEEK